MVVAATRSIRRHENGYCSQERIPLPPIRTLEEGVRIIEVILKKNVLCRHDVHDIKSVYRTMDLLQREIDPIPECNTHDVVKKVIEKVKQLQLISNVNAEGLISLYYLQEFSGDLHFKERFDCLSSDFQKDPKKNEAVANHLPCCHSEAQFNQDVDSLIGRQRSKEIDKILNRKKAKIQYYEHTTQAIQSRKLELNERRRIDPQKYPAYLDILLDYGYIHLYDHLFHMKTLSDPKLRQSALENMTFSHMSHVVLETREAIIQAVESSIPAGRPNILFLVGGSGAGKSATLCFLRGDKMVLKDNNYESLNDTNGLIGHDTTTSCTFLPNTQVVNDWVIVDFSGFHDTNGQIVSLGMEFAFIALFKKYNPKILALYDITNSGDKFSEASKFGARLSRLLGDPKEDCILGLTQYSKYSDYKDLKALEEKQENERLGQTKEEVEITTEITVLSGLNLLSLQSTIQDKQKKLEALLEEKKQRFQQPLPETEDKVNKRKKIQEREETLLNAIGLKRALRFCNLEDSNLLSSCFKELSAPPRERPPLKELPVQASSRKSLDSEDEKLLDVLFKETLVKEMKAKKDYSDNLRDFKTFEQNILESSLIQTIFSESNPEVGQFLHLPEMDPTIARKYDAAIIDECFNHYISSVICTLDKSLILKVLKEMGAKTDLKKVKVLEENLERLEDFVKGLLGIKTINEKDAKQTQEAWDRIRKEHQSALDGVEKSFNLPTWATVCLSIPIGIPIGIYMLFKRSAQTTESQKKIGEIIDRCSKELNEMYEALWKLNDIKQTIKQRDHIDAAFNSIPITLESMGKLHSSIQERIDKIRSIYGDQNWDKRVLFLADKLELREYLRQSSFDPKDADHVSCITALAYLYIEPDTSLFIQELNTYIGSSFMKIFSWARFTHMQIIIGKIIVKSLSGLALEVMEGYDGDLSVTIKHGMIQIVGQKILLNFVRELEKYDHDNKTKLSRALFAAALLKTFTHP